jgi:hypothetical protein
MCRPSGKCQRMGPGAAGSYHLVLGLIRIDRLLQLLDLARVVLIQRRHLTLSSACRGVATGANGRVL